MFTLSWSHYLRRRHLSREKRTDNSEITADKQCGVHCGRSVGMSAWQRHPTPPSRTETILQHAPLNSRDVLYVCRTEFMIPHVSIREGLAIQYYNVMSMYSFVCKYLNFPINHLKIHVGDACWDKQATLNKEGLIKFTVLPPKKLPSRPTIQL